MFVTYGCCSAAEFGALCRHLEACLIGRDATADSARNGLVRMITGTSAARTFVYQATSISHFFFFMKSSANFYGPQSRSMTSAVVFVV